MEIPNAVVSESLLQWSSDMMLSYYSRIVEGILAIVTIAKVDCGSEGAFTKTVHG